MKILSIAICSENAEPQVHCDSKRKETAVKNDVNKIVAAIKESEKPLQQDKNYHVGLGLSDNYHFMIGTLYGKTTYFIFSVDTKLNENEINKIFKKIKAIVVEQVKEGFEKLRQDVNYEPSKVKQLQRQVNETKEILRQTTDKVVERGEKIEPLVEKTEKLKESAVKFSKAATKLKEDQQSCCQKFGDRLLSFLKTISPCCSDNKAEREKLINEEDSERTQYGTGQ